MVQIEHFLRLKHSLQLSWEYYQHLGLDHVEAVRECGEEKPIVTQVEVIAEWRQQFAEIQPWVQTPSTHYPLQMPFLAN